MHLSGLYGHLKKSLKAKRERDPPPSNSRSKGLWGESLITFP